MTKLGVADLPTFPARELLGGQALEVDDVTGFARVRYVPTDGLKNPAGTVLGGYLSAMIDDAAGLATWFGGGARPFATAQMSVSFLRAVKAAEALIAEASVSGVGPRQAFIDVRLIRERDRKVVATGTLVQTFIGEAAAS